MNREEAERIVEQFESLVLQTTLPLQTTMKEWCLSERDSKRENLISALSCEKSSTVLTRVELDNILRIMHVPALLPSTYAMWERKVLDSDKRLRELLAIRHIQWRVGIGWGRCEQEILDAIKGFDNEGEV